MVFMWFFNHEEQEGHEEKKLQGQPNEPDENAAEQDIRQTVVSFFPGALIFKCLHALHVLHGD